MEFRLHEWEKDKWDAIVEQTGQERAFNNGIQQGIDKNTTSMIKSMLENNADYEFISKVSNKSIDEIKEIEKSMNLD
jgi:hypothetical protein